MAVFVTLLPLTRAVAGHAHAPATSRRTVLPPASSLSDLVVSRWHPERPTPGERIDLEVRLPSGWILEEIYMDRLPVLAEVLADGHYVATTGVGRREPPGPRELLLSGRELGGRTFTRSYSVDVDPGRWPVERLTVSPSKAAPPAAVWRRIQLEASARTWSGPDLSRRTPDLPFLRPVPGRITSDFGQGRVFNGRPGIPHLGTDLAGREGTPVVATADGRVAAVREEYLGGLTVRVDHGGGWVSHYMHLSKASVTVDSVVRRGEPVGEVGRTGRVTGPHLHFALSWRGRFVDPATLMDDAAGEGTE